MLKHARFRVGLGPREDKYDKNVLCEGFFFFSLWYHSARKCLFSFSSTQGWGSDVRKTGLTLGIKSEPGNQETWVLALLTSLLRTMASPSADRSLSQRLHLRIPTAALEAPAFPGPVVTV